VICTTHDQAAVASTNFNPLQIFALSVVSNVAVTRIGNFVVDCRLVARKFDDDFANVVGEQG
jgi:hypothetical protein